MLNFDNTLERYMKDEFVSKEMIRRWLRENKKRHRGKWEKTADEIIHNDRLVEEIRLSAKVIIGVSFFAIVYILLAEWSYRSENEFFLLWVYTFFLAVTTFFVIPHLNLPHQQLLKDIRYVWNWTFPVGVKTYKPDGEDAETFFKNKTIEKMRENAEWIRMEKIGLRLNPDTEKSTTLERRKVEFANLHYIVSKFWEIPNQEEFLSGIA